MKIITSLILVMTLIFTPMQIRASIYTEQDNIKTSIDMIQLKADTSQTKANTLQLNLKECSNVSLMNASDGKLSYSYDAKYFTITSDTTGNVTTITVKDKYNNTNWNIHKAIIYLPANQYKTINIDAEDTSISIYDINASLDITSQDSAVSIAIPDTYNYPLKLDVDDSACSIMILNKFPQNSKLELINSDSSVSLPKDWKYYYTKSFTYGSGKNPVSLNIKDSAFRLKIVGENAYQKMKPTTAVTSSNKGNYYIGGSIFKSDEQNGSAFLGSVSINSRDIDYTSIQKDTIKNTVNHIKTIPVDKINELEINSDLCGIVIEESKTGKIELDYTGVKNISDFSVDTAINNNTLSIDVYGILDKIHYINTSKDNRVNVVRIRIPAGAIKSLDIQDTTSIFYIEPSFSIKGNTTNGTYNFKSDSITSPINFSCINGTLRVTAPKISAAVKLEAVNGTVQIESTDITSDVSLKVINGESELYTDTVNNAKLEAVNGEVNAKVGKINKTVEASVTNGDINFKLTKRPVNLSFELNVAGFTKWNKEEYMHINIPYGWKDGYKIGNGKPVLKLSSNFNGTIDLEVAK